MARIRSIHPGLATDEAYMEMTAYAKVAWPLLWTECDDQGVFEWKPVVLKARLLPADNVDLEAILDELQKLGMVKRFHVDDRYYGAVKNFKKFQRPKKPQHKYPLPDNLIGYVSGTRVTDPDAEPKRSPLKGAASSPPVTNQGGTSPELSPQRKEEGGSKEEVITPPTPPRGALDEELFGEFKSQWGSSDVYRPSTETAFAKLTPDERKAAIAGISGYFAEAERLNRNRVTATRYLAERVWQGVKPKGAPPKPSGPKPQGFRLFAEDNPEQWNAWEGYFRAEIAKDRKAAAPPDCDGATCAEVLSLMKSRKETGRPIRVASEWPPKNAGGNITFMSSARATAVSVAAATPTPNPVYSGPCKVRGEA